MKNALILDNIFDRRMKHCELMYSVVPCDWICLYYREPGIVKVCLEV